MKLRRKLAALLICALVAGSMPTVSFAAPSEEGVESEYSEDESETADDVDSEEADAGDDKGSEESEEAADAEDGENSESGEAADSGEGEDPEEDAAEDAGESDESDEAEDSEEAEESGGTEDAGESDEAAETEDSEGSEDEAETKESDGTEEGEASEDTAVTDETSGTEEFVEEEETSGTEESSEAEEETSDTVDETDDSADGEPADDVTESSTETTVEEEYDLASDTDADMELEYDLKEELSVMTMSLEAEAVVEEAQNDVYVMMNIPYGNFYGSEDVDYYFDVVSTATESKFLGTTGLAKGTYNDETNILGVVYPVLISGEDYEELKESDLTENDDYYIAEVLEEEPAACKTLTYENGEYTFSEATGEKGDTSDLSVSEADTTSSYGDYMIELEGVLTADTVTIGNTTDINPSGVILETADGSTYGMGMLENIWVGSRVTNAEVAFSVVEGNGLTNHGGVAFKQFEGLNGATITSVKLVTNKGIYTIECSVELPEYYDGEEEVAAEITDADTLAISIPTAFEDATVSVSYTSGRTTVYVALDAEVADGKVALDGVLEEETTYKVTVNSSNYAPKNVSVTYGEATEDEGITEDQIASLNELITEGQALVDADASLTLLAAHIAEAQALLENADTTNAEAEELIGELEELIEEADPTIYVSMNVPYGDFYGSEDVDYYFDVVSTATTSKFLGTTGLAKGTYNDGRDILGVVYPVAMRTSVYNTLKDSSLTENDDYYIAELLEETPVAYKTLTYSDGTYSFSEATGEEGDASTLSVSEATTTSSYGDYMIELEGVLTADSISIGDTTDINPSGVILETAEGNTYGMGMLENMWVGTRVTNVEVAFSVVEGNGLTNHGGVAFKQFEGLNGATITSVKLVTNKGIYTIECSVELPEYYDGEEEVAAEITDADTLTISIPDAYENVTVSVSYTSGRTAVYVAEDAEVVDGTVALSGVLDEETTYTVTVYSSNYAATKLTVTYGEPTEDTGITEEQIARLKELIEIGQALVEEDASLTILASHIAEAQELLANADVTSAEAAELISEMEELIVDAGGDIDSDDNTDDSGSADDSGSTDSSGSTDDSDSTDTSGTSGSSSSSGSSSGRPASSNATSHGSSSGGSGSSSSASSGSTWVQDVENDDNTWWLRRTNGSYVAGSVTTDENGNAHEQIAWAQVNGAWYAFGSDGYVDQGWVLDYAAGKWYFIDINTGMKSGWHHDDQDNYWYYLDPSSGAMRIGWNQIDGNWYYFNSNPLTYTWNYDESTGKWVYDTGSVSKPLGAMYAGETTPDGYAVDENGTWIQ